MGDLPVRPAGRTSAGDGLSAAGYVCHNRTYMGRPTTTDEITIGERIRQARDELGLTQADLGSRIGLDRTAIAKIETGRRRVSAAELVQLAAALDRPIDWFVTDSPPAVVSRRADPAAGGSGVLDRGIDRLARDVEYLEREDILRAPEERHLPLPESYEDAEAAAATVRRWLTLPGGPLLDLQSWCETLGLLAFSLELGDAGRDGAYVRADHWGVALVNGSVDPGRRRFNLAHELGHHVFDDAYAPETTISPGSETERLINVFVAHLLLPRADVDRAWRKFVGEHRLAAVWLAAHFRASWTAVCSHLKNLELIGDEERRSLASNPPTAADFFEVGERWESELDPPSVPREYGRCVLSAYRSGRLTAERAVELLWGTVDASELPEQFNVPLEGLHREFEPLP